MATPQAGQAQPHNAVVAYPSKPIKIIAAQNPGTMTDVVGRIFAEALERADVRVKAVVLNKPGAGGIIGVREARSSEPDGYTLLAGAPSNMYMTPHFLNDPGFDTLRDFTPVYNIGFVPQVLVANVDFPANTLREALAYSAANPGKVNFTTAGVRNFSHVMVEVMNQVGGAAFFHIPQKTPGAAIADVIEGRSHLFIDNIAFVDPFIKEGKLKPLAFNGTNRMADYPKIPTLGERIPELAVGGRFMLVVPAGTPEAVQEWLHSALTTQMNTPEAVSRLAKFQFLYGGGDLTTIRAAFRDDYRAWERVLKIAHLPKE